MSADHPERTESALRAAFVTTVMVFGLAVWHLPLEWALIQRLGPGEGTALSTAMMIAAAIAVAFYCEPWFAGGRLDRAAFVRQSGRLLALMAIVGAALGVEVHEGAGPSIGALMVVGAGIGLLLAVDVASAFVLEAWTRLVTRARENA